MVLRRVIGAASKIIIGGIILKDYFMEAAFCSGHSMQPTLEDDDVLLVNKLSKHFNRKRVENGKLYIFVSPTEPEKLICKRVVAKEYDFVEVVDDDSSSVKIIQIPKGHVWLEGDNKIISNDSRIFGPVPVGLMHGKVEGLIWPLHKGQGKAPFLPPSPMLQAQPATDRPDKTLNKFLQIKISNGLHNKIQEIELPSRIGRCPKTDEFTSQLALDSPYVSREHILIEPDTTFLGKKRALITDLGSSNGTFINGKRIPSKSKAAVYIGDKIQLGALENELYGNPVLIQFLGLFNKPSSRENINVSAGLDSINTNNMNTIQGQGPIQDLPSALKIIEMYELIFCLFAFIIAHYIFSR